MSLSDEVFKEMKRLYDGGMTQEQVAAHCHIRHSQAQRILSGTRSTCGLELGTFDKMFPNASVCLYGNGIMQTASNVNVKNGSVNSISIQHDTASVEKIRSKIIAALIPLDIQPDALQTVLRAINELDLGQ